MRIHRLLPLASLCFAASLLPTYVARAQDDDWQVDESVSPSQAQPDEPDERSQEPVSQQRRPRKRRAEPVSPRYDEEGVTDEPQPREGRKNISKKDDAPEPVLKHFTISANPLNLALNSISVNGEYMLTKHHGLTVTPSFVITPKDALFDVFMEARGDFGIEVGYRFYSGSRGTNGFFMGPSFVYMYMHRRAIHNDSDEVVERDSYSVYGLAVDLGGAHVSKGGFFIGAGGGMMFLRTTRDKYPLPKMGDDDGGRVTWPRVLFFVGQAF